MISGSAPPIPAAAKLADRIWFSAHLDRRFRIRPPLGDEYLTEFRGFGDHHISRRRIIAFRVPAGMAKRHNVDFARLAFLAFADETIEDADEILKPIVDEIMRNAAASYGMKR